MFFTSFTEITPCQIPASASFTFLYIGIWRRMMYNKITTANAQMPVTSQPVAENLLKMLSTLVPVLKKKFVNTFICDRMATAVISNTMTVSTARSVTTVPKAFGNDTLS